MPCDTIQQSTIEFSEATDLDLLQAALEALGYEVRRDEQVLNFSYRYAVYGRFSNNRMEVTSTGTFDEAAIKQAYSREVVKASAQRFGWNLVADPQNQNKFVVQRRY